MPINWRAEPEALAEVFRSLKDDPVVTGPALPPEITGAQPSETEQLATLAVRDAIHEERGLARLRAAELIGQ